MRKLHTFAAALTIASVGVTGAAAQGKGNGGAPKAPKAPTTTVSHGNAGGGGNAGGASAGGGSSHGSAPSKGPSAPASGTQASTTTTTGHGNGAGAGKSANAGNGNGKSTTVTASTTTGSGSTSGSTTTTTTTASNTPVAPPNAVSMKISKNPQQLARFSAMLPDGMTLEQATTGFRNQGQFIAALNASKNQGVSFADLQTAMTVDGLSLGQAVRQLRNAPPEAPAAGGTTTGGTTTGGTTTGGTTTGGTTTSGTTTGGTTTTGS